MNHGSALCAAIGSRHLLYEQPRVPTLESQCPELRAIGFYQELSYRVQLSPALLFSFSFTIPSRRKQKARLVNLIVIHKLQVLHSRSKSSKRTSNGCKTSKPTHDHRVRNQNNDLLYRTGYQTIIMCLISERSNKYISDQAPVRTSNYHSGPRHSSGYSNLPRRKRHSIRGSERDRTVTVVTERRAPVEVERRIVYV